MKNQRGIVWAPILIIIGAVVVAGFAGYFLIQANSDNKSENGNTNVAVVNQANSNASANINTNNVSNTNQVANNNGSVNTNTTVNTNTVSNTNASTDPTAGWKTYTNTTYGWSVKYPPTWSILNDTDDPLEVKIIFSGGLEISNSKYPSLESWKSQMMTYQSNLYDVTVTATKVAGRDAYIAEVVGMPNSTPFIYNIGVWKDGNIVAFQASKKEGFPQNVVDAFTFIN